MASDRTNSGEFPVLNDETVFRLPRVWYGRCWFGRFVTTLGRTASCQRSERRRLAAGVARL